MLLYGPQIKDRISDLCSRCRERVFIASAYIRTEAFKRYVDCFSADIQNKVLVVRWRPDDIVSGASDLNLYHTAVANGWRLYMNQAIHAKIYRFDSRVIVGSANLTHSGLWGIQPTGNFEVAAEMSCDNSTESCIGEILRKAIAVNDDVAAAIEQDIREFVEAGSYLSVRKLQYSERVTRLLSRHKKISLYTQDLLWCQTPEQLISAIAAGERDKDVEHDLMLLRLHGTQDTSELRFKFVESAAFQWLYDKVEDEKYFGELTTDLHSSLLDDPAPLRKTVKGLLANLLEWTRVIAPDYFEIDQPNVSTRIRKKNLPIE